MIISLRVAPRSRSSPVCVGSRVCLQDKKKVACRYDWHQTGNSVVVTIYAKNVNPEFSSIEANRTVVSLMKQTTHSVCGWI